MMSMIARYVCVCLVLVGVGSAYADPPSPPPGGGPKPSRVSLQDLETMKLAKCEATNDDLVRQLLALRQEIAARDAAAHAARTAKLAEKYALDSQATVNETDGTIQRPAPPPPVQAPPPPSANKAAVAKTPPRKP
jgi:hypothetical protein